jgi:hypothetical protein
VDITFDAPHVLKAGSNPDESARPILRRCLQELRAACPRAKLSRNAATQVTWHLPTVFNAGSVPVENAKACQALFSCLTDLDSLFFEWNPDAPLLYDSGVYYKRTEIWDTTPALYDRGYGDCKSLACSLAAERRAQGLPCQPVFRFLPHQSGPLHVTYHVLNLGDQGWEDPSKVLGMGRDENSYFQVSGS